MEYFKPKIAKEIKIEKKNNYINYIQNIDNQFKKLDDYLFNHNWSKYGIHYYDIKFDIKLKYEKMDDIIYMNMKYFAIAIYLMYVTTFSKNIFKTTVWKEILHDLSDKQDSDKNFNIEKQVLIYLIKIKNFNLLKDDN